MSGKTAKLKDWLRQSKHHVDWIGNNAAFACPNPKCKRIFIVTGGIVDGELQPEKRKRYCPGCGKSVARLTIGGLGKCGQAQIEYPVKKKGE